MSSKTADRRCRTCKYARTWTTGKHGRVLPGTIGRCEWRLPETVLFPDIRGDLVQDTLRDRIRLHFWNYGIRINDGKACPAWAPEESA